MLDKISSSPTCDAVMSMLRVAFVRALCVIGIKMALCGTFVGATVLILGYQGSSVFAQEISGLAESIVQSPPEDMIKLVIENVESSEELLDDIDVRLRESYEYLAKPHATSEMAQILKEERRIFFVRQSGKYHLEIGGDRSYGGNKKQKKWSRTRLFDGQTSRALEKNVANIVSGRTSDSGIIRPHMLLLQNTGYSVPLSTYMKGEVAMDAYPGQKWNANRRITTDYLKSEVVGERPCDVVRIQHISVTSGQPTIGWVLWLASDRNYIPIRIESYSYRYSTEIPTAEGKASDFREVMSGVWFPFHVQKTAFDKRQVRDNEVRTPIWRRTYIAESVDVATKYGHEFFADLLIPQGAYVYEIDGNGEITDSYTHGDIPLPQSLESGKAGWRSLLIIVNLVVIVGLGVALMLRRASARKRFQ